MKHRVLALAALLTWNGLASAVQLALVTPKETTLHLSKLQQRELIAEFLGTAIVEAKLVAQWVPKVDEDRPTLQEFRLYIAPEAAIRLPYFEGYPVKRIEIINGLAALKMVAPNSTYEEFSHKRVLLVEVEGTFVLRDFVVGVECDSQWARSLVVRAESPSPLVASGQPTRFGC